MTVQGKAGGATALHEKAPQPVRPGGVMEAARQLDSAGDPAAALALLLRHRAEWQALPIAYDSLIGRISLELGDIPAAVDFLTRALQGCGGAVPMQLRRNLGAALLMRGDIEEAGHQLSLVLEAGGVIVRPAFLAAVAAFRHDNASTDNAGLPSPFATIVEAELLAEKGSADQALRLLEVRAATWPVLPSAYHAAMGRLALSLIEPEAAVAHLQAACAASEADLPALFRHAYGAALLQLGRVREAGHELVGSGADRYNVMTVSQRLAANAYRRAIGNGPELDTSFPWETTFIDRTRKLVYLSIPKNACSLLKAIFVMNSPHRDDYLASGLPIHRYCDKLLTRSGVRNLGEDYFSFVVLRDPYLRTLSAYLDKFVRLRTKAPLSPAVTDRHVAHQVARAIREAQTLAGIGHDHDRSISFAEFVRYLASAEDAQLDAHWMPQIAFTGPDLSRFTHVGTVERLDSTLDFLESRFGYKPVTSLDGHLSVGDRHRTRFSKAAQIERPDLALPRDLDKLGDVMPVPDAFYTPELKALIARRFASDIALYASV